MLYLLGYSGQGQLRIFGKSNEKYHVVGGNDQITDRHGGAAGAARSSSATSSRRCVANSDGTYTLSSATALGRRPTWSSWRFRSRSCASVDLRGAASRRSSCTCDRRAGHGHELQAARGLHDAPLAHARHQRRDLRRHRLPEHAGRSRAARRAARASSSTTPAERSARASASGTPDQRAKTVPRPDRAAAARYHGRLRRQARRSTSGRATPGRRARTPTGRSGSTRPSRASRAGARTTATSRASTRRSTSRATCSGGVETGERAAGEVIADLR